MMEEQNLEDMFQKVIEEEMRLTQENILNRIKRILKKGTQSSKSRSMKLKFRTKISSTILTGEEIKGEGSTSIEVALVDDLTGHVVVSGPEASANVETVLLQGNYDAFEGDRWTVDEFNAKIVREMEGKKPLLAGNVCLKLDKGVGVVKTIKFRHHTSKMKIPTFRLGARVIDTFDGALVRAAISEPFSVRDFRSKYYKKHETPSLTDDVWRLKNIFKTGAIYERLQAQGVFTVEHFLIQLLKDPAGLKAIVGLGKKKWEVTVDHACMCTTNGKMYFYSGLQPNTGVVFNVFGQLLGLVKECQFAYADKLSEYDKAFGEYLISSAVEKWEDVCTFSDLTSLMLHISHTATSVGLSNFPMLEHHDGHGAKSTTEIGECSNANFLLQDFTSPDDRPIGLKHFDSFSIDEVELYDGSLSSLLMNTGCPDTNTESIVQDFEQYAAHQKRWKVLIRALRFSVRIMAALDDDHITKKQRVC